MISKDTLKEYAKIKDYNLGQAEKDFFQEIILFILYKEFGKDLVFKGGTALTKCFGFNRFSEDLDFTLNTKKNILEVISLGLKKFYIEFEVLEKEFKNSINLVYKIKGPLYMNTTNSLCKIQLDISMREQLFLEPTIVKLGIHLNEIPMFDVVVMNEKEIFAEKIRALITRNKARDLFDFYYLLKRKNLIDTDLINKKLELYSLKFSKRLLLDAIKNKKEIWDTEMKHLVKSYPDFKVILDEVRKIV